MILLSLFFLFYYLESVVLGVAFYVVLRFGCRFRCESVDFVQLFIDFVAKSVIFRCVFCSVAILTKNFIFIYFKMVFTSFICNVFSVFYCSVAVFVA